MFHMIDDRHLRPYPPAPLRADITYDNVRIDLKLCLGLGSPVVKIRRAGPRHKRGSYRHPHSSGGDFGRRVGFYQGGDPHGHQKGA
jgi:hypothetical protein